MNKISLQPQFFSCNYGRGKTFQINPEANLNELLDEVSLMLAGVIDHYSSIPVETNAEILPIVALKAVKAVIDSIQLEG